MEDRTLELKACSRCGAWERVSIPASGVVLTGEQPRWSDGFNPHAAGPHAVRCPSCREVHVPTLLGDGPSGWTCLMVVVGATAAGIFAAASTRPEPLAPLTFLGAFLFASMVLGVGVAFVDAMVSGAIRRLRARVRGVQLAPEATPDEVIDGLRAGLAKSGADELALRRAAWWRWNHHDRALPALPHEEVVALVKAAGRRAGRRGLAASPAVVGALTRPMSYAERLRLEERLDAAVRAAGDGELEAAHLPPELPAPARPGWWEANLRRLVDLQGATSHEEALLKAEAARTLGDAALALRLLEGPAVDESPEVRGWYQLLIESEDRRVAQVPAAVAAKLPPPEDDCVRC